MRTRATGGKRPLVPCLIPALPPFHDGALSIPEIPCHLSCTFAVTNHAYRPYTYLPDVFICGVCHSHTLNHQGDSKVLNHYDGLTTVYVPAILSVFSVRLERADI